MKTALHLLLAAGLTASVLLTSGCGGQVDASTPQPKGDTRGRIQQDYDRGTAQVKAFYTANHARILSLHAQGLIGDGTAQRQMDQLEEGCSARLDAIKDSCDARVEKFDQ